MSGAGVFLIALVMVVGLIGTVVPLLPGLPIVWAGGLIYGLAAGFGAVGWIAFSAMTLLLVGGMVAGVVLPHRRISARGAPASTVIVGVIGAIVGFFVIPIVGLIVGGAVGVLVAERLRAPDWATAWATTKVLLVGYGIGVLVELSAGLAMVACWVVWVIAD